MVSQFASSPERMIDEDPFFILYDSRSGSTFLANELSKRFQVVITPETNFITDTLENFGFITFETEAQLDSLAVTITSDRKFADLKISYPVLRELIGQHAPLTLADAVRLILNYYREQLVPNHFRYGIKNGKYVHDYREILRMFPSAKFIGLIRDGRAVFHSKKRAIASRNGRPMANDPKIAAKRWVKTTTLLRELELDHRGVLILNYETLIRETERTMVEIAEFLDVKPAPQSDMPRTYEIADRYRPELHSNVNKAPLADRITAWQTSLTPSEIGDFESVARDCLVHEGYQPQYPARSPLNWKKWFV